MPTERRPDPLLVRVRSELARSRPVGAHTGSPRRFTRLAWPAGITAGVALGAAVAMAAAGQRPTLGPAVLLPTSIVVPACATDESEPDPAQAASSKPEPEHFTVDVVNTGKTVEVVCAGRAGEPDDDSYLALRHELRSSGGAESPLDPRLVELLHQIAKRTGGSVQVLSAFRPPKTTHDHNYHTRGMAADVRVAGMPAARLRDLARSLGAPGVGYYPTSHFVHVDMREGHYEWTDTSGPGQNADDHNSESAPGSLGDTPKPPGTPAPGAPAQAPEVAASAPDAGSESANTLAHAAAPPSDPVLTATQQAQQAAQAPGQLE